MDSEDGMLDAYDADSVEDSYTASDYDDIDEEDDYFAMDDSDDHPQNHFTILNESDICQRQEEAIAYVSSVLSVSRVDAIILLLHYKWNVSLLHDEWFVDEERARRVAGLFSKPKVQYQSAEMTCRICFDLQPIDNMHSAACVHPFCVSCWRGYISVSIKDGPGCLLLKCPDPSCTASIGEDMINKFVMDEDKERFSRYLIRSYIEDNSKAKWCPAPDCACAVEFDRSISKYDVSCLCSHAFCWNCSEDAHRPVDCSTVSKWILKTSEESENMNWLLANSKPCPKCKRPIEKNHGCMHMTCMPPCSHEFCWLCLGTWSEHGEKTGGFYACNKYEAAKQEGQYEETERRREMAKNSLERYLHYYERWLSNESSRRKAIQDLQQMQDVNLEKLEKRVKQTAQLKFIIEAWQQIVECRRVLKWTYAYGFYLPEHEHAKKQLFEYFQGEAETALERLHQCAEKDLHVFLGNDDSVGNFTAFQTKLAGLTSVTRTYFENLVRALENGLPDVSCVAGGGKEKVERTISSGSSGLRRSASARDIDDVMHWNCSLCAYTNPLSVTACMMCHEGQQQR